jgi:hypothetical protein
LLVPENYPIFFLYFFSEYIYILAVTKYFTSAREMQVVEKKEIGRMMFLKKIILVLSFTCLASSEAIAVPAVPNEAAAKGTVIEYCISSTGRSDARPGPGLYKIIVKVEAVEDSGDAPNFLKGKEGQEILFWSKARLAPELFGKKIKAIVEYRGDERGGKFWIRTVEIIK